MTKDGTVQLLVRNETHVAKPSLSSLVPLLLWCLLVTLSDVNLVLTYRGGACMAQSFVSQNQLMLDCPHPLIIASSHVNSRKFLWI